MQPYRIIATAIIRGVAWLLLLAPKLPTALPDEPWHTVQCAPHPPPAVISCPRIPWSRRGAGVPPRTPASVVRVRTVAQLIWRYCKMFFTESAARGLIDVIDVIDHASNRRDASDDRATHSSRCARSAADARDDATRPVAPVHGADSSTAHSGYRRRTVRRA